VKLLFDTNALLWSLNDDRRLGPTARRLINSPNNNTLVSIVLFWEIAIKQRTGKLKADVQVAAAAIERSGAVVLDTTLAHLQVLLGLPMHHRDPFDHLLIAQTITEGATLVSEDHDMPKYSVPVMNCPG